MAARNPGLAIYGPAAREPRRSAEVRRHACAVMLTGQLVHFCFKLVLFLLACIFICTCSLFVLVHYLFLFIL